MSDSNTFIAFLIFYEIMIIASLAITELHLCKSLILGYEIILTFLRITTSRLVDATDFY